MLAQMLVFNHKGKVLLDQVEQLFGHLALDELLQLGLFDRVGRLNQRSLVDILFRSGLQAKHEHNARHLRRNVHLFLVDVLNAFSLDFLHVLLKDVNLVVGLLRNLALHKGNELLSISDSFSIANLDVDFLAAAPGLFGGPAPRSDDLLLLLGLGKQVLDSVAKVSLQLPLCLVIKTLSDLKAHIGHLLDQLVLLALLNQGDDNFEDFLVVSIRHARNQCIQIVRELLLLLLLEVGNSFRSVQNAVLLFAEKVQQEVADY